MGLSLARLAANAPASRRPSPSSRAPRSCAARRSVALSTLETRPPWPRPERRRIPSNFSALKPRVCVPAEISRSQILEHGAHRRRERGALAAHFGRDRRDRAGGHEFAVLHGLGGGFEDGLDIGVYVDVRGREPVELARDRAARRARSLQGRSAPCRRESGNKASPGARRRFPEARRRPRPHSRARGRARSPPKAGFHGR